MDDIPLSTLFIILFLLILLSAFFSSSETGMMALNRYRLSHLAKDKQKGAILATALLKHPDKLIGLILIGNNVVNFLAASLGAAIAVRLMGDLGYAVAPFVLTAVFLVFAEVAPKTLAALYPERIAFPAAYILTPLGRIFYPFVWMINKLANGFLKLLGINVENTHEEPMTREELRTVVIEAGAMIPRRHQRMLISIIDLENITVDDIMVPRNEIFGIDLNDPQADIIALLSRTQHTRIPVYRDNIDDIIGMLHARNITQIFLKDQMNFSVKELESIATEAYFVPLGTPLHTQLQNFQRSKNRTGLVVDEYGVIQGLVTLEDILEEIVGEFTTDLQMYDQDIYKLDDGTYVIDGATNIRDINRQLKWTLPTEGPKTLNGLIIEQLESIPEPGLSLRIGRYTFEITQMADNAVKTVRITVLPQQSGSE